MTVTVELKFKSDNDAFHDCPSFESARILREVAKDIEESSMYCEGNIIDLNGNCVGSFKFNVEE